MSDVRRPSAARNRKVALVTGGARRLGRHIALGLADRGYNVVITYRKSAGDARRTVAALREKGSVAKAIKMDVTNPADIRKAFATIRSLYGRLDVVIGNAGVYPDAIPLPDISSAVLDDTMNTNFRGNFFLGQAAATMMHAGGRGGRIVFMASLGGLQIWKDRLAYNVSKSALITLTRAMARAVAPQGITVNAVAPGHIDMPDEPGAMPTFGAERVPMHRFGTPADIVDTVLFFTESAPYVTGQVIAVDGGMSVS